MPAMIPLRRLASSGLSVTARLLGEAARLSAALAQIVRPGSRAAEEVARAYRRRGRVTSRTRVTVTEHAEQPVARAPASHVEELAARPASEVVARIPELSTDELRLLSEHEQRTKRRKTVLAAIEDSAAELTR